MMKAFNAKLFNFENLTKEEMIQAINKCFTGDVTDSEIAAFLTALRMKGETADEIAGLAEVIRKESTLQPKTLTNVMDNCGTGGDQSNSFNISTTSAFVIAGAGVTVAKHGNRSISSKTGSADVLEHLGVSLTMDRNQVETVLEKNKIAFLFAPFIHEKMKYFMNVRKSLGLPTILNAIGPLTNPINLNSQLVGVYKREMLPVIAEALGKLGRKRAIVINGAGYMDEASLSGENHLVLLNDGEITEFTVSPEDVGLPTYSNDQIKGGTSAENAKILLNVLDGKAGAHLDTVLLNAGIGLYANGAASSINEGIEMARESIHSGKAQERLQNLIHYSKSDFLSI